MQRPIQRRLSAVLLMVLLGLLAACGGSSSPTASSDNTDLHNDADLAFVTDMIPHHTQAIAMAKMAVAQASSTDVVDLANRIQDAQQPEIDTMSGWLSSWGETAGDTGMGDMNHGGMDQGDMAEMMTSEDMQQLMNTSGMQFDRLWLQAMTKHHQGAIAMAKTELQDGQNADVMALAQQIIEAQQAEITTMTGLL